MYEYQATIVKIIDGDTVDCSVDLGWDTHVSGKRGRIRLYGIDTPESRTRDKEELLMHHHAVEYLGQSKDLIKLAHLENRKKLV